MADIDRSDRLRFLLAERLAGPMRERIGQAVDAASEATGSAQHWDLLPNPDAAAKRLIGEVTDGGVAPWIDVVEGVQLSHACEVAAQLMGDEPSASWRLAFGGHINVGILSITFPLSASMLRSLVLIDGEEVWLVSEKGNVVLLELDRDVEPHQGAVRVLQRTGSV